jgi:hypothetical protein
MISKCVACLFAAVALAGCCMSGNGCYTPLPGAPVAWDGLGSPPSEEAMVSERKPKRQPRTEAVARPDHDGTATSDAKPFSKERLAQQEAADRVADGALAKKLVICRGCSLPPPKNDDATGSVPH